MIIIIPNPNKEKLNLDKDLISIKVEKIIDSSSHAGYYIEFKPLGGNINLVISNIIWADGCKGIIGYSTMEKAKIFTKKILGTEIIC